MPTYTYSCSRCEHTFDQVLSMDDRKIPEQNPCPECKGEETVIQRIGAPKIVTSTGSMLGKAGSEWRDVLKKVKSGSGMSNTIND